MSPEALLSDGHVAMYAAKKRGYDRVSTFAPALRTAARERLDLIAKLSNAIPDGQLVLHYQPVVNLKSWEIIGVEALVRWRHPDRGLLHPDSFLQLATETGLVVSSGNGRSPGPRSKPLAGDGTG